MAIKTFQGTLKSFIYREATTLSAASHQNVVRFVDLENIVGTKKIALIMEHCEENLSDVLDKNPNGLLSTEFMPFCQDLVNGMKHLRGKNIIHRDIKPGNILLLRHDGQTTYKLGDFGAARLLKVNETYSSLYGTFEYMHPALFARFYGYALDIGIPQQTFKDDHDLWSIGVTMFEAASGELPFEPTNGREDPERMYNMIVNKACDCISAKEVGSEIEWSRQLPENSNLDSSTKQAITPLLAGLLQVSI